MIEERGSTKDKREGKKYRQQPLKREKRRSKRNGLRETVRRGGIP